MFDFSWGELVIIGMVALIAIGPKELPGVLRGLGHWMGKVRRMASDFQDQFREAMREAEVADLKRQFDEASANATSAFSNPLQTAQKEVEAALGSEPPSPEKVADETAVTTADPGAIEPSAGAPAVELDRPAMLEPAVADAPATDGPIADAPLDIKPDSAKPGGSGAA
ncbi:Sec-independent protein translocase protein TatB [Pseudorhodoplanes sp.]|uniref:Sec-independent protein translocase protein TatB n=1 Tax=Pseudorhodoplanes sp. TaxID=1934341 RepID=UPI003D0C02AE